MQMGVALPLKKYFFINSYSNFEFPFLFLYGLCPRKLLSVDLAKLSILARNIDTNAAIRLPLFFTLKISLPTKNYEGVTIGCTLGVKSGASASTGQHAIGVCIEVLMLTETYALVALSVGQASVRVSLMAFQNYVHANLVNQQSITLNQMEYACDTLNRLYQACHWHKIEKYLMPAIREATERADDLLDELANVNTAALDIIHTMRQQAGQLEVQTQEQVAQICKNFDDLCAALLLRLEKEERELIAVARSVIQREAWFSIANQFLTYDANLVETRRTKVPAIAAPELNLGMFPGPGRLFDLADLNLPFKSQVRVGK